MGSLLMRRREMMRQTSGGSPGPQLVRVYFSDCQITTGYMVKSSGSVASSSNGSYVTIPYKEGMLIHTILGNWSNYIYAVIYSGSTHSSKKLTKIEGSKYETTLEGYSDADTVKVNYQNTGLASCYYEYYE